MKTIRMALMDINLSTYRIWTRLSQRHSQSLTSYFSTDVSAEMCLENWLNGAGTNVQEGKRMSAIATEIEQNFPELKNDFYELLANENKEIRLWVAHHILEHMNYERSFRKNALMEIRSMARTDKTTFVFLRF